MFKCLQELYGLEIVSAVRIEIADILNTVYRISTEDETFFLKLYCPAQTSSLSKLNETLKLQVSLSQKNLAPRVIANCNNSFVSEYGNYVFSVQEYVPCREVSVTDRDIFAKSLATLHNVFNEMDAACSDKIIYKSYEQIQQENEMILMHSNDQLSLFLVSLKLKILSRIQKDYAPPFVARIHGDCRPSNSMIDCGRLIFIDFDYTEIGDLMYEIGNSLLLFSEYDYTVFAKLLDIYNSARGSNYSTEDVLYGTMMCVLKSSFPIRDKHKMKAATYRKIINEKIKVLQFCSTTLIGAEL